MEYETFDDVAQDLCRNMLKSGLQVSTPRTGGFTELRNVSFTVNNPRARWLCAEPLRQVRLWAYGEVLTEFLGLNPPIMESYTSNVNTIKLMNSFHRLDGRANYTYGERWHNAQTFQRIIKRLQNDRYSRQAVMNIWDSSLDLDQNEWNVPCTLTHQFLIRQDELNEDVMHTIVTMRSQDFLKGFRYDTYLNSFLAEAMAGATSCKLGTLTFFIGSFHVYDDDYEKLKEISTTTAKPIPADISFNLTFESLYEQLWEVKELEEKSRRTHVVYSDEASKLHPYFRDWAIAYMVYNSKPR